MNIATTNWQRALLLAALSPLSASLAAQTNLLPSYWPATDVRTWADKANHPGDYGRMVTARISDFGYPDAVFLVGNEVMLMTAPALMWHIAPLPGAGGLQAHDLCNVSAAGGQHTLAICGPAGLTLWSKTAPTAPVLLTGTSWAGAQSVRLARGAGQVVGRNAQGNAVVRADLQTATELPAWTVPGLLAVTTFDIDGDGTDEVGIVTTTGFEVRSASGALVVQHAGSLVAAEAGRMKTPLGDGLVCLCNVTGHTSQFLVLIQQYWQPVLQLPSQDSKNLSLADLDGDGWQDITMSWTGSAGGPVPSLDVLWNLGASQATWFGYQPVSGVNVMLPHGTMQTANPAPPLQADLDGDGATDSIIPLQGHNKFSIDSNPFAPNSSATMDHDGTVIANLSGAPTVSPQDPIQIQLALQHGNVPAAATHIELHGYRWDVLGGGAPQYESNWRVELPLDVTPLATIDSAPMLGDDLLNHAVMFVLRYVQKNEEAVEHAWPPRNGTVTLSPGIHAQIVNLPGVTQLGPGDGGIPIGGVTKITPVPKVQPPTGFEDEDGD